MNAQLVVDGREVPGDPAEPGLLVFRVRLPAAEIRLVSAARRASDVPQPDVVPDRRLLGILVHGLIWQQGEAVLEMPLASPEFGDGFHYLESAMRWTNGDALLPVALLPPWQGEATLFLRYGTWAEPPSERPALHPAAPLLGRFEALGENCEFAYVQRHFDVTLPLSLLRWGGTSFDELIAGLESGFALLGEPEHTQLAWGGREYTIVTPYLRLHSFETSQATTPDAFAALFQRALLLLRLLRRKLLHDIAEARRLFLFKTAAADFDEAAMHRLHAALRRNGPRAALLCVSLGAPDAGVRRLAEGLYAGTLERFVLWEGPYDPGWRCAKPPGNSMSRRPADACGR